MVEGKAYVEAGEENYVLEPGDLNISGSALPPISSLIAMAAVEQKLSVYFSKEKFNQEK